jgi:hypothetical protein
MSELTREEVDRRIPEVFHDLEMTGDMNPTENANDYWRRKLVETFDKARKMGYSEGYIDCEADQERADPEPTIDPHDID